MGNACPNARGPNATYIQPARVGSMGAPFWCVGLSIQSVGLRVVSTSPLGSPQSPARARRAPGCEII